MDRQLVVPAPPPRDIAEFLKPPLEGDPARGRRAMALDGWGRAVRLAQLGDVAPQDVLELGDEELLVLLLVLDAGEDEEAEGRWGGRSESAE